MRDRFEDEVWNLGKSAAQNLMSAMAEGTAPHAMMICGGFVAEICTIVQSSFGPEAAKWVRNGVHQMTDPKEFGDD